MSLDGFTFEGRDVTARELSREVVYQESYIQSALESGAQTFAELTRFCERRLHRNKRIGWQAGKKAWDDTLRERE